jgi:hypothetical protein
VAKEFDMGVVEFLKSVGGVTVPDEVIQQARQNEEEQKKQRDDESESGSRKKDNH